MSDNAAILIVDDRNEKVLALEGALEGIADEVVRANSGREALRFILQREFAVILLDVNMPGMDGFETASLIRLRKQSEHVPIIFVTAFGDEMHAARGYSLGAVDYILAPVMPEVLRSKVGVFVDLYRKSAQLKRQAESLERRAVQLQKLAAASVAINSASSLEKILQTITNTAREVVGAHQAITLFVGSKAAPAFPAAAGSGSKTVAVASFSDRYATWRNKPLRLDPIADTKVANSPSPTRMTEAELLVHPDWEIVRKLDIPPVKGQMLAAPLQSREGTNIGVIYLSDPAQEGFTSDDEAMLVQLAQMGSITIENTLYAHEREANRLKDEFLATLSHELRTPLNAMLGWAEILRSEPMSEEVAHGLTVIERNVVAQTKLVEDLLDVSRITTGKLNISHQAIDLHSVVEAAVDAVRPTATEKKIILHADLHRVRQMAGDPDRLQQVVWNLLNNAVKFTPAGGRIEVTLQELGGTKPGDQPTAEIRVMDNGQGIDPHFLPYVFDRFRQADSSSTRRHGGLGIGLALVRNIVELHSGSVQATSQGHGHGATFLVRLPMLSAAAVKSAPPHSHVTMLNDSHVARGADGTSNGHPPSTRPGNGEARHAPEGTLAGIRILLVEDEMDARNLLTEILRRAGATVVATASVKAAMDRLQDAQPDVVVSDIAMPGEDGFSFIRRLRDLGPENYGDVPAIAVTAFANPEDRSKAIAAGFQDHVPKPVTPATLIGSIAKLARAVTSQPAKVG